MKRSAGILATLSLALYGCTTTNAPAVDPRDEKIQKLEASIAQLSSAITADRRSRYSSPAGVADVHSLALTLEAENLIYGIQITAAVADQRRRAGELSSNIDDVWDYNMWHYFAIDGQLAAEERARTDADTKFGERVGRVEGSSTDLDRRVTGLERAPAQAQHPNGPAGTPAPEITDEQKVIRGQMTMEEYNRRNR